MVNVTDPKIQYRVDGGWADALTGTITPVRGFPTRDSVGVYAVFPDWVPHTTIGSTTEWLSDYSILEPGVYEHLRFVNTVVYVRAPHVTFRYCEFIGTAVNNAYAGFLYNGMIIEDCTFAFDPPGNAIHPLLSPGSYPVIAAQGYTARRCNLLDVNEGFRGGSDMATVADPDVGEDPRQIRIYDCWVKAIGPDDCTTQDWHGDALQFYDSMAGGGPCKIRNTYLECLNEPPDFPGGLFCVGTGCILAPNKDITYLDLDGVICSGGATLAQIECPGDFRHWYFIDESWLFGPLDITQEFWPLINTWEDVYITALTPEGQPGEIFWTIQRNWPGYGPLDPPPS